MPSVVSAVKFGASSPQPQRHLQSPLCSVCRRCPAQARSGFREKRGTKSGLPTTGPSPRSRGVIEPEPVRQRARRTDPAARHRHHAPRLRDYRLLWSGELDLPDGPSDHGRCAVRAGVSHHRLVGRGRGRWRCAVVADVARADRPRSADRPPGPAPAADRRSSASRARRCCCSRARSRGTRRLALLYFAAAAMPADKFGFAPTCSQ